MILVVIAMEEEAKVILQHPLPHVKVILSGVGKVNAASSLTEAIMRHQVTKILNLGFAGAYGDFQVGDVILVKRATYHDFDLSLFGYSKGQVPGYPIWYEFDQRWGLENFHLWKTADLKTGDYFQTEHYESPCLYDMEATALFQIAHRFQVPMISIKVVSDLIGTPNHFDSYREFEAGEGAKRLYEVYQELLGGTS